MHQDDTDDGKPRGHCAESPYSSEKGDSVDDLRFGLAVILIGYPERHHSDLRLSLEGASTCPGGAP